MIRDNRLKAQEVSGCKHGVSNQKLGGSLVHLTYSSLVFSHIHLVVLSASRINQHTAGA